MSMPDITTTVIVDSTKGLTASERCHRLFDYLVSISEFGPHSVLDPTYWEGEWADEREEREDDWADHEADICRQIEQCLSPSQTLVRTRHNVFVREEVEQAVVEQKEYAKEALGGISFTKVGDEWIQDTVLTGSTIAAYNSANVSGHGPNCGCIPCKATDWVSKRPESNRVEAARVYAPSLELQIEDFKVATDFEPKNREKWCGVKNSGGWLCVRAAGHTGLHGLWPGHYMDVRFRIWNDAGEDVEEVLLEMQRRRRSVDSHEKALLHASKTISNALASPSRLATPGWETGEAKWKYLVIPFLGADSDALRFLDKSPYYGALIDAPDIKVREGRFAANVRLDGKPYHDRTKL